MDGHVCPCGDASLGQCLEHDGGVQPGEAGAAERGVAVDGAEAQLGHLLDHVHGEVALGQGEEKIKSVVLLGLKTLGKNSIVF